MPSCCSSCGGATASSPTTAAGDGRCAQAGHGHDMDRCAAKAATVAPWSCGRAGGAEVARYITGRGGGRVAGAVLLAAVPSRGYRPLPVRPSVRGRLPERHPERVVPGGGRQRAGASRGDQSVRGDGLHRRPLSVLIANFARSALTLAGQGDVKVCPGLSHGVYTVSAGTVSADLLDFIRS